MKEKKSNFAACIVCTICVECSVDVEPSVIRAPKMKFFVKDFFLVSKTKSAGNCIFGHIYWRNP